MSLNQNEDLSRESNVKFPDSKFRGFAIKAAIKDILNKKIQDKVNVVGTIVTCQEYGSLQATWVIDDGKDKIMVRNFNNQASKQLSVGDSVIVLGWPRDFNEGVYIAAEISKSIDPLWIKVRIKYLDGANITGASESKVYKEVLTNSDIASAIKDIDEGAGVPLEKILKLANKMEDVRLRIDLMLKKGDIFEISPGRLKVLE